MRSISQCSLRTMQSTSLVHRAASRDSRPQHEAGCARSTSEPTPSSQLGETSVTEQSLKATRYPHPRVTRLSEEEDPSFHPATLEWLGAQEFPKPAWSSCHSAIVFLQNTNDSPVDASTVDWLQTQEFPSRAHLYAQVTRIQGSHYRNPVSQTPWPAHGQSPVRTCVRAGALDPVAVLCDVSTEYSL